MSNDRIVEGQVFPTPTAVRYFRVNCGSCGSRCELKMTQDYVSLVNSDEDGKTSEDRRVMKIQYALKNLWSCETCGVAVDIRSQEEKLIEISKHIEGSFQPNQMRLESTRQWIRRWI